MLLSPLDSSRRIASLTASALYDKEEEETRSDHKKQPDLCVPIWLISC
jgi:hypothetical protein